MKKLLIILIAIMGLIAAQGTGFAIDIDDIEDLTTTVTPSVLADRLVGAGNVTGIPSFTGAPVAAGTFGNGMADGIGLDQGIILSTGDISFALGPNRDGLVGMDNFRPGDNSLNGFVSGGTMDASALEFDFIPPQNRVTFTFAFASDEYPEFVNSQFNDVFGLFVNGVNIARVPGTTNPITIDTLNGTATPSLFNDNSDLFLPRFMTQYDGFSNVLSVSAIVTPGIANRIKVVIADTADPAMDSAVFLGPAVYSTATFSISGTITSGGVPLSGVSVALSGDATANTTTNASGVYTFTVLANGNYTVTPSLAGFAFAPVNRAVTINNADITGQDFTALPTIFSISGTISTAGVGGGTPVAGVTVNLTGAASASVATNALGVYTFSALANGSYTVTPTQAGFTFTPVNRAVTINNASVTGQNFTRTAAAGTFSISGTITSGGLPQSGVSVALTGAATANTTTNASGAYSFTGLANGNYTVTPTLAGFTFVPVNRAVLINNANVTGQDFTGTAVASTFSISGTITSGGLPLSGVSVALTGGATANTTTNASGAYSFTGLANGNYTVTPSLTGFTFAPVNRAIVINNANVTGQDFIGTAAATFSISGTVRTAGGGGPGGSGGTPVAGVTMNLSGAASASVTTNALGVYTFSALANGSYTVTPSQAGSAFTPVSRAIVINNANVISQDFTRTAAAATFSISGTITSGGLPLSGVSVALTGAATANTTTNASGVYTFTGRANGNYTVTPTLAGFTFAPVNRAVVINNANVTGQDFTGTAASTFSISGTVRTAGGPGGVLGTPVAGVTITLGGAATGTTTTNALGVYTFTGLANGNYTVTPSLAGFTFTPANGAVTVSGANVTGQNFTRN